MWYYYYKTAAKNNTDVIRCFTMLSGKCCNFSMNISYPHYWSQRPNWLNDPAAWKQHIQHFCPWTSDTFQNFWPSSHVFNDSPTCSVKLGQIVFQTRWHCIVNFLPLMLYPMWNSYLLLYSQTPLSPITEVRKWVHGSVLSRSVYLFKVI